MEVTTDPAEPKVSSTTPFSVNRATIKSRGAKNPNCPVVPQSSNGPSDCINTSNAISFGKISNVASPFAVETAVARAIRIVFHEHQIAVVRRGAGIAANDELIGLWK